MDADKLTLEQVEAFYKEHHIPGDNLAAWAVEENAVLKYMRDLALRAEQQGQPAQSKSRVKRLSAQGANVLPPASGETPRNDEQRRIAKNLGWNEECVWEWAQQLERELAESDNDRLRAIGLYDSCKAELAETMAATRLKMPTQGEILLACGEMTTKELRAVKAVLGWFISRADGTAKGGDDMNNGERK